MMTETRWALVPDNELINRIRKETPGGSPPELEACLINDGKGKPILLAVSFGLGSDLGSSPEIFWSWIIDQLKLTEPAILFGASLSHLADSFTQENWTNRRLDSACYDPTNFERIICDRQTIERVDDYIKTLIN